MTRHLILMTLAAFLTVTSFAQETESAERLREEFLRWRFGMFLHFNMATFHNVGWSNGHEDPESFAPARLDCNQWAEAAQAAGMKYAVLTVKHTGGWCLWDSKHTTHDIASFSGFKNGKGDIVREFVDACRKYGLKVGLYYCFPGDYFGRHGSSYLPSGKEKLHGMPPEAKGDYTGFIKKQMTELLTQYGKIDMLWIDQYRNKYTRRDWSAIKKHIKSLQPNCVVLANNSHNFKDTDIHGYEFPCFKNTENPEKGLPPEGNKAPTEVCDLLGVRWFWDLWENDKKLLSAEKVVKMLELCNSRRANYLLNVAPDRSGLIPKYSVDRLREIGKLLDMKHPSSASKSNR